MSERRNACTFIGVAIMFCGAVGLASAQQPRDQSGQTDDAVYQKIVNDFIRFDIGQIRDPIAIEQIKARFNALRADDAVPALVRGLNASTRMRASCPITALSSKLRGVVSSSKNPNVGTFVLQNLDRNNGGPYSQLVNSIFDVAEAQVTRTMGNGLAEQQFKRRAQEDMQRLAHTPGLKLTDLATREPGESVVLDEGRETNRTQTKKASPSRSIASRSNGRDAVAGAATESAAATATVDLARLRIDELAERLGDRTSQAKVLAELSRRASAGEDQKVSDASPAIERCLTDGDDAARESAARLLGLVRSQRAVARLIDALDDSNPKVRSAAATSLTRITRQLFGPNDDATAAERQVAITRWREWWSRQGKAVERSSSAAR
jgi:hypothetical protein